MLPDDTFSSESIIAEFTVPVRSEPLVDFEWGDYKLQNSEGDLNRVMWTCFYEDSQIKVSNGTDEQTLLHVEHVTALSFAFDLSMRPTVTYVLNNDECYLWWYDTSASAQVTTKFGNCQFPQLSLDERRQSESANADVIFSYIRNNKLYMRYQRERYGVEHYIADAKRLTQIGMMKNNRFGFQYYNWD